VPQFDDRLEKEIDEWLYVMKHGEVPTDFQSPSMQKVADRLNILNMSQGTRNEYLKYNKEIATYKDAIGTAKEAGIAEGLEIGIEQGMQKGIQCRNLEIAKNMLKKGLDTELIQEVTNLSRETIEALKK
jgi:predicted transposase/invertase (TIGR01784 family)